MATFMHVQQPVACNWAAAFSTTKGKATGVMAGLARTLFMEDRAAYGTSVDLPSAAGRLPTVGQLQALTQHGSEYAVALRGGRALSLRLQPAAEPLPRCVPASYQQTGFVSGGAKVSKASEL